MIRPVRATDAAAIAAIYNHYVTETTVTFEEEPVSPDEMGRRIQAVVAQGQPWLVAEVDGQVAGYAYATKWHHRHGYRYSAEVTVYLAPTFGGRGLGTALYNELFPLLEASGIRSLVGVIALPNPASVALHEKFGMRKVGHLKAIGMKFGEWIDVGYWQKSSQQ
ncbi:MAG TPA: GNAT family N-acetyltransferase [Gemmatimonadales bacterium]|nr:GNAT family N-acetyltransferase [Gemmatimonadales bacterium]